MAALSNIKMFLEFEPIVKLACDALDCKNNLVNASYDPNSQMLCCNLKQILISKNGVCQSYEPVKKGNE